MQQHYQQTGQVVYPAPQLQKDPTSLDIYLTEMNNQISRYYNALNVLERLSQQLKYSGQGEQDPGKKEPTPPQDHCGKFDFQNGEFNNLNSRLEYLVDSLSKVI